MDEKATATFKRNENTILSSIGELYSIDLDCMMLLDGFESMVWEFARTGQNYILKLTHSSRQTSDCLMGSIDFLRFLVQGGVPASPPVQSAEGNLLENIEVDDGSYFSAYAFEKAPGIPVTRDCWTDELYFSWGKIAGHIHRLTKDFSFSDASYTRPHWHEEDFDPAESYLPSSQRVVLDRCRNLVDELQHIPKDRDSYGLLHDDLNPSNFFINNGSLIAFDFDDCTFDWFASEIAACLFYAILRPGGVGDPVSFSRNFLASFFDGYSSENLVNPEWISQIPTFLKVRELIQYIVIHRNCDLDNLHPWCRMFMDGRQESIERNHPFAGIVESDLSGIFR